MSLDTGDPTAVLVHDERIEFRASALDGVAVASIAAGFVTPLAALAFDVPGAAGRGLGAAALAAVAFLAIGFGLHLLAVRLLGKPVA